MAYEASPGRWLTVRQRPGSYQSPFFIEDERGRVVASLQANQLDPEGLSMADAERFGRLMAASPDMLAALDELKRWDAADGPCWCDHYPDHVDPPGHGIKCLMAKIATNKARNDA